MLDGWYCRTMANQQNAQHDGNRIINADRDRLPDNNDSGTDDDSCPDVTNVQPQQINANVDYKSQYTVLKKKLKFLLYENEFFQDALRSSQRRLLKVTRDRSFLLDRLLQYERPEQTSSESEETESSDEEKMEPIKKRKLDTSGSAFQGKGGREPKRKKVTGKKALMSQQIYGNVPGVISDGHMTTEEVERHLQSRQSLMELLPERAPPTVPTEMFSNEPSLDSESNDQMVETSPSNIGEDCISVDLNVGQKVQRLMIDRNYRRGGGCGAGSGINHYESSEI